jgi:hypothetical protein
MGHSPSYSSFSTRVFHPVYSVAVAAHRTPIPIVPGVSRCTQLLQKPNAEASLSYFFSAPTISALTLPEKHSQRLGAPSEHRRTQATRIRIGGDMFAKLLSRLAALFLQVAVQGEVMLNHALKGFRHLGKLLLREF